MTKSVELPFTAEQHQSAIKKMVEHLMSLEDNKSKSEKEVRGYLSDAIIGTNKDKKIIDQLKAYIKEVQAEEAQAKELGFRSLWGGLVGAAGAVGNAFIEESQRIEGAIEKNGAGAQVNAKKESGLKISASKKTELLGRKVAEEGREMLDNRKPEQLSRASSSSMDGTLSSSASLKSDKSLETVGSQESRVKVVEALVNPGKRMAPFATESKADEAEKAKSNSKKDSGSGKFFSSCISCLSNGMKSFTNYIKKSSPPAVSQERDEKGKYDSLKPAPTPQRKEPKKTSSAFFESFRSAIQSSREKLPNNPKKFVFGSYEKSRVTGEWRWGKNSEVEIPKGKEVLNAGGRGLSKIREGLTAVGSTTASATATLIEYGTSITRDDLTPGKNVSTAVNVAVGGGIAAAGATRAAAGAAAGAAVSGIKTAVGKMTSSNLEATYGNLPSLKSVAETLKGVNLKGVSLPSPSSMPSLEDLKRKVQKNSPSTASMKQAGSAMAGAAGSAAGSFASRVGQMRVRLPTVSMR